MRLVPVLLLAAVLPCQRDPDAGLVALRQACLDATADAVVLNIAAHPDDEAGRTLVILRRKHGLRTVTAYSTYGDGGQNAIGREIGPELAAIRVRETLSAAGYSGVQVRWLSMSDFGFSKTMEETLRVWGKEELLQAMRRVLRETDPDVVFTNHSLDRGHGHHRASRWAIGVALQELAQQTGRVVPLFERSSLEKSHFAYDPGELDPVRGETYGRQAHRAWVQHRSQGPWGPHNPLWVRKDYWRMVYPPVPEAEAGESPAAEAADGEPVQPLPTSAFDHLGTVFDEPAFQDAAAAAGIDVDELRARFDRFAEDRPAAELTAQARSMLPGLRALLARLGADPNGARAAHRLQRRVDALQRIVLAGSGTSVEVWLDDDRVPQGGKGRAYVLLHGAEGASRVRVRCGDAEGRPVTRRAPPRRFGPTSTPAAEPAEAPAAEPPPTDRFQVDFACAPLRPGPEPAWAEVVVELELDGLPLRVTRSLPYTPVPDLALRWDRNPVMVPAGAEVERIFSLTATNHLGTALSEPLRLGMGPGIRAEAIPSRIELAREHPEAGLLVRVDIDGRELDGPALLKARVGDTRADLHLVPVAVTVDPRLHVGLVRGPDDTLHNTLDDLGIPHQVLDVDRLAVTDLSAFSTLVLDIRAYHHRRDLSEHKDRILRYCRGGGRVVVFYHKPREWNEAPGHPLLAPFPMRVGNQRVTEEDAEVTLLQPDHRVWNHPHRIGPEDFAGWVQERGLNFPGEWDDAWTPLMAMKDSGEEELLRGALLYTDYGKGQYLYCSLALYRQLRAAHAGAARILLNLLTP